MVVGHSIILAKAMTTVYVAIIAIGVMSLCIFIMLA